MLLRRRRTDSPNAAVATPHAGPYPHGWEVPARFNFTRDVIEELANDQRTALTFVDREGIVDRRTFSEIAGDAARWAHLLRTRVDRGDRVLVLLGKVPAWHGAMLGALKGGVVAVPCSDMLRARDLAFRVRHSGARLVVADRACEVEVEEMREQVESTVAVVYLDEALAELSRYVTRAPTEDTTAGEAALLLYTSGTTKEPKGVVHTHAYTWAARAQAEYWLDAHEQDVVWCTAGTGWAKSIWNVLLGPWSQGAEIVVHESGFDPEERLALIQKLGVTILCQAPTEYRLLAKLDSLGRAYLPRLRHAVSAGEPLNAEVIERFRDTLGITVHDGYGQTENSLLVANAPGTEIRPGSMGLPTPGHDVAVIDEAGDICEPDVEGDLALRGSPPTLFTGYWDARDETASVFRDGWYLTGDRATCDEDGYLWFVGRADDVILSAAYRIGPFEVESALLEHPAVAESAVVGVPDEDRGQIVKAFVVLRSSHEPSGELVTELQEHVKTVTAPYKYPRAIAFLDELPKTASGKIRRSELRLLTGIETPARALAVAAPAEETELALAAAEAAETDRREAARREAAAAARRMAEETARREAEAAALREAEETARREAEEARREAEAAALREAEEAAGHEAEEEARREAEAAAQREAEETARLEAEAAAQREAEETARLEAEAAAQREAEETARLEAEATAQREAEEAARLEAEAAAQREAEEAARLEAEATAQREAEEAARLEAEAAAQREAEEAARLEAEAAALREAEELARREAEEQARREAEEQARREAEAETQREAEAAAQREAEEAARLEAEAAAQREAEEAARMEAEAAAQREAEEAARMEAEAAAQREAEEAARLEAEAAAQREAEEAARQVAAAAALREAEEAAQREAEEAARRAADAAALREAEESAEREAAELARREAEEQARLADEADDDAGTMSRRARRAAEKAAEKQRKEEERQRAKAEAEQRKRDEIEAKERAKAEAEQRKRDEIEAKERAKAEAEQRKRDEIAAREDARRREAEEKEAAKQREQDERRRRREEAKRAKGRGGLGRLLSRDEDEEDLDEGPVEPIEGIVERLQPYSTPRPPIAPVPDLNGEDDSAESGSDTSD